MRPDHPAILPLVRYCAYQERCIAEVMAKMEILAVDLADQAPLLALLQDENYINEARFAGAYARGKHRHNGWGKAKIRFKLQMKGVPMALINQAFQDELTDEIYLQSLQTKLETKFRLSKPQDDIYTKRQKIAQYLVQLGYESDLVWDAIRATLG